MFYRNWWQACVVVMIGAAIACSSESGPSLQSPSTDASASGTVLDTNDVSVANVNVTFEQYDKGVFGMHHDMMHEHDWEQSQHAMTDDHGRFHFEYMHDGHHEYRVRVDGSGSGGMCYLNGGVQDDIVLHVSNP